MRKLLHLLLLGLLASCTLPVIEAEIEGGENANTLREVHILTRSASGIHYPLTIYAFDTEEGKLVKSETLHSEAEDLQFTLPTGDYHVVAVAGAEGCDIPSSPTLSSLIQAPPSGLLAQPLQMGSASVKVMQNTTVSITLYNQVAAVNLSLCDIPHDVKAVSVSFSLMASAISLDGKHNGNATTTISLTREEEVWLAPMFYTLPCVSENLGLSITTTTPTGNQVYGYTHPSPLKANTPYAMSGSLTEGFIINGSIALAGWNETEEITFNFGGTGGGNNDNNSSDNNKDEVYEVTTLPEVGSLWNGQFVVGALDIDDPDIIPMLLLSLSEWTGVTSATHEETPDMAAEIAAAYTEGDLTGWRIPTRREVNKMCATLGYITLEETNAFLSTNGIVPLSTGTDSETKNTIRYLCDDAAFSFTWDSEGSPSKAGSKRGYHLRLVNSVRFRVIE